MELKLCTCCNKRTTGLDMHLCITCFKKGFKPQGRLELENIDKLYNNGISKEIQQSGKEKQKGTT